ncbi:MAG TPA: hypothetical protein VFA21_20430 [Pyrinomonadaceae bacterium]|jgi:CBS domain-containing protein|nr:hypothetical protein [Pyrinomonadaceae bacterium]
MAHPQTPNYTMTPTMIVGHIKLAGFATIEDFADDIEERRDSVSQVINYLRFTPRIRRKIEAKLGITLDPIKEQRRSAA